MLELRLWASMRGQTLVRTVDGEMVCERALRLQAAWDGVPADQIDDLVRQKFSTIVSCQIYGAHDRTRAGARASPRTHRRATGPSSSPRTLQRAPGPSSSPRTLRRVRRRTCERVPALMCEPPTPPPPP